MTITHSRDVGITFTPARDFKTPLEIHLALLALGLKSEVRAGENAGRTLRHAFVVVGHTHRALLSEAGRMSARLQLPKTDVKAPRFAVAGWIERAETPGPLQAVGGWLK